LKLFPKHSHPEVRESGQAELSCKNVRLQQEPSVGSRCVFPYQDAVKLHSLVANCVKAIRNDRFRMWK